MKNKSIFFTLMLFILSCAGCNRSKCDSESDTLGYNYLVLDNKNLEREIVEFSKFAEKDTHGEEYIIHVYYRNINDSISRYCIAYEFTPGLLFAHSLFIYNVGGQDVFFTMSGISTFSRKRDFFAVKDEAMIDIMKKYFPKHFDEMINKKGEECVLNLLHAELWYLTFLDDKLIGKTIKPGFYMDRVPVVINGKETWL